MFTCTIAGTCITVIGILSDACGIFTMSRLWTVCYVLLLKTSDFCILVCTSKIEMICSRYFRLLLMGIEVTGQQILKIWFRYVLQSKWCSFPVFHQFYFPHFSALHPIGIIYVKPICINQIGVTIFLPKWCVVWLRYVIVYLKCNLFKMRSNMIFGCKESSFMNCRQCLTLAPHWYWKTLLLSVEVNDGFENINVYKNRPTTVSFQASC